MQSSALPLGHAANKGLKIPLEDSNSKKYNTLIIICNGHGEDVIALEIIKRFLKSKKFREIQVMPLVGNGYIFDSLKNINFKKIGHLKVLPSGGFNNQNLIKFLEDIRSGMLVNILKNLRIIRSKSSEKYKILAIGDLLPLFFAWNSKCDFGFIGTPKSDYTWASGPGWAISDFYHKFKGSEWDPWEIFFMKSKRCKAIVVRDNLTAKNLNIKKINANFFGNPMMDFVDNKKPIFTDSKDYQKIILLIGSRYPEALYNFESFLSCLNKFRSNENTLLLLPLTRNADLKLIKNLLQINKYFQEKIDNFSLGQESIWVKDNIYLLLGNGTFRSWAPLADLGLANAGTATEQIAGLGIPSLSLPGKGPQFTKAFARRQERLLGGSVYACHNQKRLVNKLNFLLANREFRDIQAKKGRLRMGKKGASKKIVDFLNSKL